ncbi:hypothetical protein GALMADRAFT_148531 [Galerina marginata CBS 339.88]|uniref:Uncharacterized protein n=1 Tax=Galerina marginata (strain CBS 339.88) TaxID=685588 RepID=A0A067S496_GALM3|nr:hypothetical protein GALMADRAFT_148531 [Galerina marginata CBS 339.88]
MFIQTTSFVNSIYPPTLTSSASTIAVAGLHGPPSSTSAHDKINQPQPCDLVINRQHCRLPHLPLHPLALLCPETLLSSYAVTNPPTRAPCPFTLQDNTSRRRVPHRSLRDRIRGGPGSGGPAWTEGTTPMPCPPHRKRTARLPQCSPAPPLQPPSLQSDTLAPALQAESRKRARTSSSKRECRLRDDARVLASCQPPHIAFQLAARTWEATVVVVGGGMQRFGVAITPLSPPTPLMRRLQIQTYVSLAFAWLSFARSLVKPNRSTTTSPPPPIASTNDPPMLPRSQHHQLSTTSRRHASSPHAYPLANADEPRCLATRVISFWLTSSPA